MGMSLIGLSEIQSLIFIGSFIVGVIAWFIRIEFTVKFDKERLNNLETRHEELKEKLYDKMTEMEKLLYEIKGKLSNNYKQQGE